MILSLLKIKKFLSLKNIATIIGLISIILNVWFAINQQKLEREKFNIETELKVKVSENIEYKAKNGQLVKRTYEYYKTYKELKESKDSVERQLYEALVTIKSSKRKGKDVKKATYLAIAAEGNILSSLEPIIYKDTIIIKKEKRFRDTLKGKVLVYPFDNGYLNAKIKLVYNDSSMLKRPQLTYKYSNKIFIYEMPRTVKRKHKFWQWLLGDKRIKGESQYDVISEDKDADIKIQVIKVGKAGKRRK